MSWEFIIAVASPVLAAITVFASAFFGRHAARAAVLQAKNAGRAAVKQAATDERRAASADWAAYTKELREFNDELRGFNADLADRLKAVERGQEEAQLKAEAAEVRAAKAEQLYALAIVYLRRIASWVNDHWPGVELPAPPHELLADL